MASRYIPAKKPRIGGRQSEYQERYCTDLIIAGRAGMSLTAFAGSIGKCRDTLQEWAKKYPAFAAAKKMAEAASAFYWETKLRTLADTGKGNAAAIIFALKNRVAAEWREQMTQTLEGSKDQPLIVSVDPAVLEKLSTDQQEALQAVLKAIGSGAATLAPAASKPTANPARYAETLRPNTETAGRA